MTNRNNSPQTTLSQAKWTTREGGGSTIWYLLVATIIMAGTAYYEYPDVMLLVNRHDGMGAMMEIVARQDKYFDAHEKYATTLDELGYEKVRDLSIDSPKGFYRIHISEADGAIYTLSAEPQGTQVEDARCAPLTYTSKGHAKSSKGSSGSACW